MQSIRILNIQQIDSYTLEIEWTDHKKNHYDVRDLRKSCPCANCVDEKSGELLLDPKTIPDSLKPIRIRSVGHYALNIIFNDGHASGIYTFDRLYNMNSDRKID